MCSRVLFLLAILLLLENCIASEVLGLVQSSYHAEYNPLARAEPVPNDKSKMSFTLLVQSNFSDGLKSRAPPNTPDYVAQVSEQAGNFARLVLTSCRWPGSGEWYMLRQYFEIRRRAPERVH